MYEFNHILISMAMSKGRIILGDHRIKMSTFQTEPEYMGIISSLPLEKKEKLYIGFFNHLPH